MVVIGLMILATVLLHIANKNFEESNGSTLWTIVLSISMVIGISALFLGFTL